MTTNKFVDKVLGMPPEKRRRLQLVPKGRPRIKGDWTKDKLIAWAKERGIRSTVQLNRIRVSGEPNDKLFYKVFGSWTNFTQEAYGFRNELKTFGADYMIQCGVAFNLRTIGQWDEAHKKSKDLVPRSEAVLRQFGTWRRFKLLVSMSSVRGRFLAYIDMRKKLKRWPTQAECAKLMIDLAPPRKGIRKSQTKPQIWQHRSPRRPPTKGRQVECTTLYQ